MTAMIVKHDLWNEKMTITLNGSQKRLFIFQIKKLLIELKLMEKKKRIQQ